MINISEQNLRELAFYIRNNVAPETRADMPVVFTDDKLQEELTKRVLLEKNYEILECYITHTKYRTTPDPKADYRYNRGEQEDEDTMDDPYFEVVEVDREGNVEETLQQFDTYFDALQYVNNLKGEH